MLKQLAEAFARLSAFALPTWIALRVLLARARTEWTARRELTLLVLVVYALLVATITVMPLPSAHRDRAMPALWSPLPSLLCLTSEPRLFPSAYDDCARNLLGNIALFLPLGAALRWLRPNTSAMRVTIIALAASLTIELTQLVQGSFGIYRTVDSADVILNVAGALLGFALAAAFVRVNARRTM